jgi:hypothetical protein
MVVRIYQKLNKITFATWVDKVIDQSLTKDNIRSGFRVTNIWPLNLRAMDERTQPSTIYIKTTTMDGEHSYEDGYISGDPNDHV